MAAKGWLQPADTQGREDEVRAMMQSWAEEYADAKSFEAALDSARVPLGTVKAVADIPNEQWAQERQVFATIDVNGEERLVPRSPVRFNQQLAGPKESPGSGSALRGAHNRETLMSVLGLSADEVDALEKQGVLQDESNS